MMQAYTLQKIEIKVAKWGTPKKYLKKVQCVKYISIASLQCLQCHVNVYSGASMSRHHKCVTTLQNTWLLSYDIKSTDPVIVKCITSMLIMSHQSSMSHTSDSLQNTLLPSNDRKPTDPVIVKCVTSMLIVSHQLIISPSNMSHLHYIVK
jgi:hypothetical protein